MIAYTKFLAFVVGVLLPWQTRFIFRAPVIDLRPWDFGIVGVYFSQLAIAVWIVQEAWFHRVVFGDWVRSRFSCGRAQLGVSCIAAAVLMNIFLSADRLLTIIGFVGAALLVGLFAILRADTDAQKPFFIGILFAAAGQALLALTQIIANATFASSFLGVAAHRAADSGVAVIISNGARLIRAYGGMPHPNIFGGFMVVALAIYMFVIHKWKPTLTRWQTIEFIALLTAALFFSYSRSAWIAAVVLLCVFWRIFKEANVWRVIKITAIVFFIIFALNADHGLSRITAGNAVEMRSFSERYNSILIWKETVVHYLFFGTGFNAYTAATSYGPAENREPTHSVPLLAFAEFGVIGFALFGLAFFLLWPFSAKKISGRSVLFFSPFLPIALLDHYLFSLWPGLVLTVVWCMVYSQTERVMSLKTDGENLSPH